MLLLLIYECFVHLYVDIFMDGHPLSEGRKFVTGTLPAIFTCVYVADLLFVSWRIVHRSRGARMTGGELLLAYLLYSGPRHRLACHRLQRHRLPCHHHRVRSHKW